jgi:glycosyltransferase involved in cell wall biosynthesis
MHILTFNWHTPYISLLVQLDHSFDVAPANPEAPIHLDPWHENMRPLMPNVSPITKREALNRLKENHYDLILGHNVGDLIFTKEFSLPKILVFHTRLITKADVNGKPHLRQNYRQKVRELISGVYCIFIAQSKRYDWGLPGEVIMPGIDIAQYGGYTGYRPRAIRVGNFIKLRDITSGYSIQVAILRELPNLTVGDNPDIPGSRPSKNWEDLKSIYRDNRLFLNTNIPKWEDGYNLAMLEAMATGMPVVSLANPVSPLTDGRDGFVSKDVPILRERVKQLLEDLSLAREIGAAGTETVERLFPIEPFLEKWEAAIRRAHSWFPHKPANISASEKIPAKNQPVECKNIPPERQNIILSYTAHPATPAAFLERALRKNHNLITVGSKLTPSIINAWGLQGMGMEVKPHDIDFPELTIDIPDAVARIPRDFNADLFIWVETGLGRAPKQLERLDLPKAAWFLFSHLHFKHHLEAAKMFDIIFVAQKSYVEKFKLQGFENVYWLPLACEPDTHGKVEVEKSHDIGFAGSLADERRAGLWGKLSETFEVCRKQLFMNEMAQHFSQSRMVFNSTINNGLNMRFFEALCSGSMLLTDRATGLTDLFQNGKHLVIYEDRDLIELAHYYLFRPTEREEIAKAGMDEVVNNHTFKHRADQIVKLLESI